MSKYSVFMYYDEQDQIYLVSVPDLPGCMADGKTPEEAVKNAQVIIDEWIETAQMLDREVPQPSFSPCRCKYAQYSMVMAWSEEDQAYIVSVPELPGCMSDGKTPIEAIQNTQEVIGVWLETAKEDGWNIPDPTYNKAVVSMC